MSELRARMLRDMTVWGFSPRTHEAYVRQVVGLARHYRRAPQAAPTPVCAFVDVRRGNAARMASLGASAPASGGR